MMKMREKPRQAFSLLEVLTASAVGVLLLVALSSLLGASLASITQTTRSVQAHKAMTQLLEALQADLRDLSPPSSALPETFFLASREEEVVMALVRPEGRFADVRRQGYYRHVEYRWEKSSRVLTRTVYHAADDLGVANLGKASDASDHHSNAERLSALTPAWITSAGRSWRESAPLEKARLAALEAPLIVQVEEFAVECFQGWPGVSAGSNWSGENDLPAWVEVRVGFRTARTAAELRHFTLVVPVHIPSLVRP